MGGGRGEYETLMVQRRDKFTLPEGIYEGYVRKLAFAISLK